MAVVKGEWNLLLLLISLLPLMLFAERKQKIRFWDLNTQLYIKIKHKKWYEWTSYCSIITDEVSAVEIKSSIEMHCEGLGNDFYEILSKVDGLVPDKKLPPERKAGRLLLGL